MKLFIGSPSPRSTIEVSEDDYDRVANMLRIPGEQHTVTDLATGKTVRLQTAECTLPGCWCCAEFVQ